MDDSGGHRTQTWLGTAKADVCSRSGVSEVPESNSHDAEFGRFRSAIQTGLTSAHAAFMNR